MQMRLMRRISNIEMIIGMLRCIKAITQIKTAMEQTQI